MTQACWKCGSPVQKFGIGWMCINCNQHGPDIEITADNKDDAAVKNSTYDPCKGCEGNCHICAHGGP